jgi:hypothetical protein
MIENRAPIASMFSFQSYTIAIMIGRNSVNRDRCETLITVLIFQHSRASDTVRPFSLIQTYLCSGCKGMLVFHGLAVGMAAKHACFGVCTAAIEIF